MGMALDMTRDDWSPAAAVEQEAPAAFEELLRELSGGRSALARRLDQGLAPDAFKKTQALLDAYDAAAGGLKKARERRFAQK